MIQKKTAVGAVDDYLNSLLFDTQMRSAEQASEEPVLRFAHVERGLELVVLWRGPLNDAQALYRDFMLLSLCRTVTGQRLKQTMLNSLTKIGQ